MDFCFSCATPQTVSDVPYELSLVWLRRDLRLDDNAALYEACAMSRNVCVTFVVDRALLASPRMGAPLVTFFFEALAGLHDDLRRRRSDLAVLEGDAADVLPRLANRLGAQALFFNEDYEPRAIERDRRVTKAFEALGATCIFRSIMSTSVPVKL